MKLKKTYLGKCKNLAMKFLFHNLAAQWLKTSAIGETNWAKYQYSYMIGFANMYNIIQFVYFSKYTTYITHSKHQKRTHTILFREECNYNTSKKSLQKFKGVY